MKSIANYSIKKLDYPCLMKSTTTGSVVLFAAEGTGTCIHVGAEDDTFLGEYSDEWDMVRFKPFDGTITLSND